jgi:hypothetical protein
MLRVRTIGLALVAVLAMSAVAAASASAHEFVATASGETITGSAKENQVFTTKAGKVTCTALKVTSGKTTGTKAKTQVATIGYEKCTAFGLEAKITAAEYEFNAEIGPGTPKNVKILKAITITAPLCTVTVPVQTVGEVTYKNVTSGTKKEIELVPNVTGITSSGSGLACSYASESKGTYTGTSLVSVPNSIEWL